MHLLLEKYCKHFTSGFWASLCL